MGLFSKKKKKEKMKQVPIGRTAKKFVKDNPKKLVKELVGTGFFYNQKLGRMNISDDEKYNIHKKVKEAWKNGASAEDIQSVYDKLIYNTEIRKQNIKKRREDHFNRYVRSGFACELIKTENVAVNDAFSNIGRNSLLFGAKYGFLVGSLTSETNMETKTINIPARIKVVPNGVVITPENDEEIRIPFDEIITFNNKGIKTVEGSIIPILNCNYLEELRTLINKSASGVEEEGWS